MIQTIKEKANQFSILGMAIAFSLLLYAITVELNACLMYQRYERIVSQKGLEVEKVRALHISDEVLSNLKIYCEQNDLDLTNEITLRMMVYDYELLDWNKVKNLPFHEGYISKLCNLENYELLYDIYHMIFTDLVYFPVPEDLAGGETVSFDDSWYSRRTYGGERKHEGTDIMASNNLRGYFPVVSITDGVVEKKGWLEKGGYRIGIRSTSGAYFYYAHLHSYAQGIEVGDEVKAGQLLGFMGDTGYSKVEGTTGNFAVHLHMGIYIYDEKFEKSMNPYWILKYLERKKLQYYF